MLFVPGRSHAGGRVSNYALLQHHSLRRLPERFRGTGNTQGGPRVLLRWILPTGRGCDTRVTPQVINYMLTTARTFLKKGDGDVALDLLTPPPG